MLCLLSWLCGAGCALVLCCAGCTLVLCGMLAACLPVTLPVGETVTG